MIKSWISIYLFYFILQTLLIPQRKESLLFLFSLKYNFKSKHRLDLLYHFHSSPVMWKTVHTRQSHNTIMLPVGGSYSLLIHIIGVHMVAPLVYWMYPFSFNNKIVSLHDSHISFYKTMTKTADEDEQEW